MSDFASEVLHARLEAGLSQDELGQRCGTSGDKIGRIERNRAPALTLVEAAEVAAVLGLDLLMRVYPSGVKIRDAAQARAIGELVRRVGEPLRHKLDVPLPQKEGSPPELRAWDLVTFGHGERTAMEYEARLTDIQALFRRHNLKRRDDPTEHFLLVLADTRHNRRVLGEYSDLFADLPRLHTADVLDMLKSGQHPPTGLMFLRPSPHPAPTGPDDAGPTSA